MYALRPVTRDDFELLWELHCATMREYVQATWGWDEQFQRDAFARGFLEHPVTLVIVDDQPSGCFAVESRAADEYLRMIELHPRVQRRGIGAAITRQVIARAEARRVPAALRVLKVNVGARRLYQRLGFVVVAESETHYDMRYG